MRGNRTLFTWIAAAVMVLLGTVAVGWVFLHQPSAAKKESVEAVKPNRWNIPKLETPAPARASVVNDPTITGVRPASIFAGRGETQVTIDGTALEKVTGVVAPESGILFSEPDVSPDGRRVTVQATPGAATTPGSYRLLVRTPAGVAKPTVNGLDHILVEAPQAAVLPKAPGIPWVPPMPEKTPAAAGEKAAAPIPAGPPAKPVIDPTLARRLSAPISTASGGGGTGEPGKTAEGDERAAGASSGVDMGRTKIGVSRARRLADLTLMIPAGSEIGCVLDNNIQTDQPGFVSCSVSADIYGSDGTVVLVDRGSQIIGEYRATSVTYGKERVFVVWSRIRTPTGVLVEIDSPGTGALGEAGFGGWVDNHYFERVGIPIMMSVVTYGIQTTIAAAANNASGANNGSTGGTTTGYNSIGQVTDNSLQGVMAELAKIKPTLHVNQGSLVNVLVMRDLDMGPAYRLARTGE